MELINRAQIHAPLDVVWRVTMDVEQWPRWTPTVTSIQRLDSGAFNVGSQARVKQPGLPVTEWTVIEMMDRQRFTWSTQIYGMRMTASHEVGACPQGTESVLRLKMTGPILFLMGPLLRLSAKRSLERENEGLKRYCESLGLADGA